MVNEFVIISVASSSSFYFVELFIFLFFS